MMSRINYSETAGFQKEIKKLAKRFRSLCQDLETLKTAQIELYHIKGIDNLGVFRVPGLIASDIPVYKIKKFACKALKGKGVRSGVRVIYAFHQDTATIVFIEIYFKGDKQNEDKDRINEYLKENA